MAFTNNTLNKGKQASMETFALAISGLDTSNSANVAVQVGQGLIKAEIQRVLESIQSGSEQGIEEGFDNLVHTNMLAQTALLQGVHDAPKQLADRVRLCLIAMLSQGHPEMLPKAIEAIDMFTKMAKTLAELQTKNPGEAAQKVLNASLNKNVVLEKYEFQNLPKVSNYFDAAMRTGSKNPNA